MTSHSRAGAFDGSRPSPDRPAPDPHSRRPRRTSRRPLIGTLAALGVLLALVLGACSAGPAASDDVATLVDPSASPDPSPSASLDPEAAMQAFASCMRQHGIDLQVSSAGDKDGGFVTNGSAAGGPKGSGGPKVGSDKDKAKFDAANKACAPLLPKGGVNGGGPGMDAATQQKMLDFSACMRDHGINMPDPKFENGGATVQIGGDNGDGPQIDPNSQAFKDAQKACESLLPDKGAGAGGGPSTQQSQP